MTKLSSLMKYQTSTYGLSVQQGLVVDPKIVFFSGGTALREVASCLTQYTKNATYLITPFDSGGSSAVLRQAFSMPAVGDLRSRLISLADRTSPEYKEKILLFEYRLPKQASSKALLDEMCQLRDGNHPMMYHFSSVTLQFVKEEIRFFLTQLPEGFDLSGASIGNILLTSRYLQENRDLFAAVTFFSHWLGSKGVVKPLIDANIHLCVQLENGEIYIGQHRFTGKKDSQVSSPIRKIWFSKSLDKVELAVLKADTFICEYIHSADLICFPMGSFFSSVVANLLPVGIAEAIRNTCCPKVFIPNLNNDPELFGLSLKEQIQYLGYILRGGEAKQNIYPDIILVDRNTNNYPGGIPYKWLIRNGIQLISTELITKTYAPYFDPQKICQTLIQILNRNVYNIAQSTMNNSYC